MKYLFLLTITAALLNGAHAETFADLISKFLKSKPDDTGSKTVTNSDNDVLRQESTAPINEGTTCDGECLPFYLCKNQILNTDGSGVISIRKDSLPNPCNDYAKVCCKPEPTAPSAPTQRHFTEYLECGLRNAEGIAPRITGRDNEAQVGEFPWMATIFRIAIENNAPLNVYVCGGALIHPSVVLTAAHCVLMKKTGPLKIRVGEWDTQTNTELFPHQDRTVGEVVVHSQYYPGGLFNDIALIFLSSPVTLTNNVGLICLPKQDEIFDNSRCFASGWGKDLYGIEGRLQMLLKYVDLPVVSHQNCEASLRSTRLGNYFQLHESFICAGGEPGKDTCQGDGGSPLVCPLKNDPTRYEQAGIVAWGIGCGESDTPGVYVNVAKFRNWIEEKMVYHQHWLKSK